MNRAYSLVTIKAVDADKRVITGIASTPTPDRQRDIVEPDGAKFALPLPLLWQHDSRQPIGHVTEAKITRAGIKITATIAKDVSAEIDRAWSLIKAGLVRGLSIGFRVLEHSVLADGGWRIEKWEWLELSAVTIPAQSEATIQTVKQFDTQQRAATGRTAALPGVTGSAQPETKGKSTMKTVAERIAALEASRAAKAAAMETIMQKAFDAGREELDDAEKDTYDDHASELKGIDETLARLHMLKRAQDGAKAIEGVKDTTTGTRARERLPAQVKEKVEPGIRFARFVRVNALAHKMHRDVFAIAQELYGERDPEVINMLKAAGAAIPAVTTVNAAALIGNEGGFADFVEFLRERSIIGRFGQNGIPSLRGIPFRVPLITQTHGGVAYWVGEGEGKPLTRQQFGRTELAPLKVAVITAVTMETLRDSSPSAERVIRDDLAAAIIERLDLSFIDPGNSGSANISPPSITDDIAANTVTASGTGDADDVRADVRLAMAKFIAAKNPLTSGVWVMSASTALALQMMVNELGNPEFPGITMNGGVFFGLPVITSEHVDGYVVLVNALDIWLGDEGGIAVDMSSEASLQMVAGDDEGSTQHVASSTSPGTPVATAVVSMFQTNSVAFRAERTINWARRRASGVALIEEVAWGEAVDSPSA